MMSLFSVNYLPTVLIIMSPATRINFTRLIMTIISINLIHVIQSQSPYIADDDNSTFTVSCSSSAQCRQRTIVCPKYAQCNVECHAENACHDVCYSYLVILLNIDFYAISAETIYIGKDYMANHSRIGQFIM